MPDLQGFLQLSDQQIKEAEAQADIALKFSQAEINWQAADHTRLQNVALLLNIQWDAQAHRNLLRMKTIKLQRVRELTSRQAMLERWTREVVPLIAGGSINRDVIRDAWIAFKGLRTNTPIPILIKAFSETTIDPLAFEPHSWLHLNKLTGEVETPSNYIGSKDMGSLWWWATKNNYYPTIGNAAWANLSDFLGRISLGTEVEAAKIEAKLAAAQAEAKEFLDKDYERLKIDRSK